MTSEASRELLEAVHQFPGKFVFKAVGRADGEFVASVVAVVRDVLDQDFDSPYETRGTPAGRHVAVTVVAWVETSDDVLLIYARIREVPGLVMLL
jgi:putative lipoic acid-binding regulatory protein